MQKFREVGGPCYSLLTSSGCAHRVINISCLYAVISAVYRYSVLSENLLLTFDTRYIKSNVPVSWSAMTQW